MATYHVELKAGKKGSAEKHSRYIAREQEYRNRGDLLFSGHGNMPSWALESPRVFWRPADMFERANGAVYREMIIALPRGMEEEQLRNLVEDMIPGLIAGRPYQYAVHTPDSSIDGGENPHLHLMYSDRVDDGVNRPPEQYFMRYNPARPDKGGCKKLSGGLNRLQLRDDLIAKRRHVADVQNAHLKLSGRTDLVDYRTLKEQGVERPPERHLGPARVRQMGPDERAAVAGGRGGIDASRVTTELN